ncbi:hypothetical protein [Flavobacterium sp.]|uniref:hypothetical protein n=1 Tax=Flavobacterium sp. TaxID=239 RepID=UPI00261DF2E6|nr:hypothetical protein [Flavobacterium sp.]
MINLSFKPENNNSLEELQLNFKKESYFSSIENDNDLLDDELDDFYYQQDLKDREYNYDGFEFDNFD